MERPVSAKSHAGSGLRSRLRWQLQRDARGDVAMTLRIRRSEEPAHTLRVETRWPVAFAVLAVALLVTMLPDRVRVFPVWAPYVLAIALIVPMAAIMLTSAPERWFRIERTILLIFFVVALLETSRRVGGRRLSTICSWDTRPRRRSAPRMSCR